MSCKSRVSTMVAMVADVSRVSPLLAVTVATTPDRGERRVARAICARAVFSAPRAFSTWRERDGDVLAFGLVGQSPGLGGGDGRLLGLSRGVGRADGRPGVVHVFLGDQPIGVELLLALEVLPGVRQGRFGTA